MIIEAPAFAALGVQENVDYLEGAKPGDAACRWEAGMVSAASAQIERVAAKAGGSDATHLRLAFRVVELKLSQGASKNQYSVTVRGDVLADEKLVGTQDFQRSQSFRGDASACDTLLQIGGSIGKDSANWVSETRFMECLRDCVGIHPDEVIVVGSEVLMPDSDAVNETVRNDCHWLTAMVGKVVSTFNESDPKPRSRLESRVVDIEKYPGRRLLLRVNNLHAVGGGGFTGPKWLSMSGELWDGKSLVASFESYTGSGRGLTTCRSVDSLTEKSADMISEWLLNPTLGAKL
jgi:hypothetical protein